MLTGTNAAKYVARKRYAWPGGYALALVLSDGGTLCPRCIRQNWREIVQAYLWADDSSGWQPIGLTHAGEQDNDLTCVHCDRTIS